MSDISLSYGAKLIKDAPLDEFYSNEEFVAELASEYPLLGYGKANSDYSSGVYFLFIKDTAKTLNTSADGEDAGILLFDIENALISVSDEAILQLVTATHPYKDLFSEKNWILSHYTSY